MSKLRSESIPPPATMVIPDPALEIAPVPKALVETPSPESAKPVEPRVFCPKCKAENQANQVRCAFCRANLLPGESLVVRLITFAFCWLAAGFIGRLAYLLATDPRNAPPIFGEPYKPAFIAAALLIGGVWFLFHRTPRYSRYCNRADRHLALNLPQAVDDYSRALEIAPKKELAGILNKRAAAYEKMNLLDEATRDRIAYTYEDSAHEFGANLAGLFGADRDAYKLSRSKTERDQLIKTGRAIALGYCSRCQDAVQLTPDLCCLVHGGTRIKNARLFVPGDLESGRQGILEAHRRSRYSWLRRLIRLAVLILLALGTTYIFLQIIGPERVANEEPGSLTAMNPSPDQEVTENTFHDGGISFSYPSDWETVDSSHRQTLLRTTLKGLGEYEYIGGVFTGGVETCKSCAHMVLVIVQAPEKGPMTPEQYEVVRSEAENKMGSRLLDHQMREFGGVPAAVSKYLGISGETQQWDVILLAPGEEKVMMFSCSAHRDEYERFEPVFTRAMETLAFDFALTEPASLTASPEPVETGSEELPVAIVDRSGSSINVRSGPGTQFKIAGGLPRNTEVEVLGRNEAGDWLKISNPAGWISAELVSVSVPIESLPVIGENP